MWWIVAALAAGPGDFAGTWKMDPARSDDPDALLRAWGASWLERRAARSMAPTQIISVTAERVTIVIETSILTRTDTLILDGSPQASVSRAGGPVTTRSHWADSALVSRSELTTKDGRAIQLVATRTIEDGGATMRQRLELIENGTTLSADRVFARE